VDATGRGGTGSPGARRPFLVGDVCTDAVRFPDENRPFALGADATRRMKRLAEAPTPLGESGPREDEAPLANDCCEAVCGSRLFGSLERPRPNPRCLSAFSLVLDVADTVGGNVGWEDADVVMMVGGDACGGRLGETAVPESVDGVVDE
jgi:hypothetical protein